jgi:hypothetical protein
MRRFGVQTLPRWRLLGTDYLPIRQLRFTSQKTTPLYEQAFDNDDDLSLSETPSSTITIRERHIFEKLFREVGLEPNLSALPSHRSAKDTRNVIDELPEELQGMAMDFAERLRYKQYMAELRAALGEQEEALNAEAETDKVKQLRQLRVQEHDRILSLLNKAKSDSGLWEVLQKELFSKIQAINLDDQQLNPGSKKKKRKIKGKWVKVTASESMTSQTSSDKVEKVEDGCSKSEFSDFEVLGPNYSRLVLSAVSQLRTHFPSSQFPFTIFAEIKRLGLQSYALGTSTRLFNEVISASWTHHGDFHRVASLLEEMERTGMDFDWETLEIVREIRRAGYKARSSWNDIVREVAHLDFFSDGYQKISKWRDFIKSRLEAETLRHANEEISTLGT